MEWNKDKNTLSQAVVKHGVRVSSGPDAVRNAEDTMMPLFVPMCLQGCAGGLMYQEN